MSVDYQICFWYGGLELTDPQVDVLVTSAGYGTIQHALRNGVPLVSMGAMEDKPVTGIIIQETEVGVYHFLEQLEPAQILQSIDEVLGNAKYKQNAQRLQGIYKTYDPVERLEAIIQRETRKFDALLERGSKA